MKDKGVLDFIREILTEAEWEALTDEHKAEFCRHAALLRAANRGMLRWRFTKP